MEAFSDYGNFHWLRANVITMWNHLYQWREPHEDLAPYQADYPVGFPIGAVNMGPPPGEADEGE